jgi:hypothetical protein
MCAPVAALALVGGIMSATAGAVGTIAKIQQANMEAQVATANANSERQAAAQDQTSMNQAALQRYQQISQMEGEQRAVQGANGVNVDFGSPSQVRDNTAMLGAMDVNKIYQQGFQAQRGHDVAIANDQAQASAARNSATMAGIGGALQFGSSVLGGVSQYKLLQNKMGMGGITNQSGGWSLPTGNSAMSMGFSNYGVSNIGSSGFGG